MLIDLFSIIIGFRGIWRYGQKDAVNYSFIYIYMYIYMCVCVYIYTHIYIYIHTYTCTYICIFLMFCWPASWYIRITWTNKMHWFLLIYFNSKPLYVSSRLTAQHKEDQLCLNSNWYSQHKAWLYQIPLNLSILKVDVAVFLI